jgi:ketosteroid isomerase-like protein
MVRSLARVLFAGAGLVACSPETVSRPPPPPVNWTSLEMQSGSGDAGRITATDNERAATTAYVNALSSPGFKGLKTVLDEDAHFSFAGFKDIHGRDNVVKAHETLLGAFDDRHFVLSRVLLTDASQVVEWVMTGVHRATKKPVGFRGLSLLWTKDDGSLSDLRLYFDEAVPNAQIGAGPKGLVAPPLATPSAEGWREVEQTRAPTEAANSATVRATLDALESKTEAAYVSTMTDDVELTTLENAQPARGKGELKASFRALHKAIGDLDTSIDNIWAVGSFVAVEYHIVGEQRASLGWLPAQKDTLLKMFVVDVVELQDGKISHIWRYDNPSQILSAPQNP